MRYIRQLYFCLLRNLFTVDLNNDKTIYIVTYLDGSRKTFMPHEFKLFKEQIVNNLYLKNKCSIKVK